METKYILVPENTINAYKLSSKHTLSQEEMAKIVVNRQLIQKFIQQKAIALQFDIGMGLKKGEETLYLKVVQILAELSQEIGNSKKVFEGYIKEKRAEEEKEKEKI